MVLADVVEIVGHGALDVTLGIILQQIEKRDHGLGITLIRTEPRRPWQSWTSSLRDETTHVDVGILSPLLQVSVSLLGMSYEECADAGLRGEALRKLVLRAH